MPGTVDVGKLFARTAIKYLWGQGLINRLKVAYEINNTTIIEELYET